MRFIFNSTALRAGFFLPTLFIALSCCAISCMSMGRVKNLEQETALIKAEVGNIQTKLGDIITTVGVNISSDSITTTMFIAGGIALVVAVLSFLVYTSSHRFKFLRDVIDMIKGKAVNQSNNNGS